MCDKCAEFDKKIEHYREIAQWVTDPLALEGIDILTKKYEADRRALHCEQENAAN
jgi:hypothetical protein